MFRYYSRHSHLKGRVHFHGSLYGPLCTSEPKLHCSEPSWHHWQSEFMKLCYASLHFPYALPMLNLCFILDTPMTGYSITKKYNPWGKKSSQDKNSIRLCHSVTILYVWLRDSYISLRYAMFHSRPPLECTRGPHVCSQFLGERGYFFCLLSREDFLRKLGGRGCFLL